MLAGVFATAMGSLSAALNALATSATNDWYLRCVRGRQRDATTSRAARWFTALFAVLMIVIAGVFAYAKVTDPDVRIIPVVLGIAGFILGPMLGVFLIGMFTQRPRLRPRQHDRHHRWAWLATIVVGQPARRRWPNRLAPLLGMDPTFPPRLDPEGLLHLVGA